MTKLIDPVECSKCGELYGLTNLQYQGVPLWQTCKCGMSDDNVMLINTAHLKVKKPEPTELERAANVFYYNVLIGEILSPSECFIAGVEWLADKLREEFLQGARVEIPILGVLEGYQRIYNDGATQYMRDIRCRLYELTKTSKGK